MSIREMLDILYSEVSMASRLVEDTKQGPRKAHDDALAALKTAVERYTALSMDGKVPNDLKSDTPAEGCALR